MDIIHTYSLIVKSPNSNFRTSKIDGFETAEDAREHFRLQLKPWMFELVEIKKFDLRGREVTFDY